MSLYLKNPEIEKCNFRGQKAILDQCNGQLNLFCSSYENTHFKSLGQKMRTEFQKQNFGKILAKKSPDKHFCGYRGHNFQPILKIWGRRYGRDEQHTKKSAP